MRSEEGHEHRTELHNFYCAPDIARVTRTGMLRAWEVVCAHRILVAKPGRMRAFGGTSHPVDLNCTATVHLRDLCKPGTTDEDFGVGFLRS
jgi:hypothetical protein